MNILFHEQAVCKRGAKMEKKGYLMRENNIATWLYHSLADSKTYISYSEAAETENGFLWLSCDTQQGTQLANFLRDIIIYCLPTAPLLTLVHV